MNIHPSSVPAYPQWRVNAQWTGNRAKSTVIYSKHFIWFCPSLFYRKWVQHSGWSFTKSELQQFSHDETISVFSCWDDGNGRTFLKLQHGTTVCMQVCTCVRVHMCVCTLLELCHHCSKYTNDLWPLTSADGPSAESCHQSHVWCHFVTDKKTDHLM